MDLYEEIVKIYPELSAFDFGSEGTIALRDDSDGQGAYIEKWDYDQPIPEGLTLGKPSA